ncbi:hypothetical protein ANO11243_088940 [Dothideomycetidae sp. 11243]|nr:hypothetical protein ANO11243_088940 [fungal sp. No.11243]
MQRAAMSIPWPATLRALVTFTTAFCLASSTRLSTRELCAFDDRSPGMLVFCIAQTVVILPLWRTLALAIISPYRNEPHTGPLLVCLSIVTAFGLNFVFDPSPAGVAIQYSIILGIQQWFETISALNSRRKSPPSNLNPDAAVSMLEKADKAAAALQDRLEWDAEFFHAPSGGTSIILAGLIWIPCALLVTTTIKTAFEPSGSSGWKAMIDMSGWVLLCLGAFIYGLVWYVRSTTWLVWESLCAISCTASAVALYWYNATDPTWQAQAMAGALAFLALPVGLLVGLLSRAIWSNF